MRCMILLALVSLVVARSTKLEVSGMNGSYWVEMEELLEKALEKKLADQALDVDVDEVFAGDGTFRITIRSARNLQTGNRDALEKALNDLGFSDATVKDGMVGRPSRYYDGIKETLGVTLNPNTMEKTMQSFAMETVQTTDLDVDDHP